eukprot:s110_g23.t1
MKSQRGAHSGELQTLKFGFEFDRSLDGVSLPDSLQTLVFGGRFDQSLEHTNLPSGLKELVLGDGFDQSLDKVVQSCYATSGCSWLQGDWSSCSSSCGLGLRQRSVTCSSGEDSDCVAGERPSSSEACYELSGCSWQTSSWSGCSATCGLGLRTRQVWCDSLVDADCQGNEMPVRSESCYNTSSCTWHEGPWSECSNDCGDGQEVRSITCSGPGGDVDCADTKPSASRSCFSAANCAWQVDAWQLCNVSCGIGHQERVVHCPTGNDLDCPESQRPRVLQRCYRQDGCRWLEGAWSACSGICEAGTRSRNVSCLSGDASDCSQVTRPLDQEACNQQAAGCLWSVGPWSSCSALSCGGLGSRVRDVRCPSRHGDAGCAASKPREVEACLSETVCEWRLDTEWSDCDASCGSGLSTRVVSCSAGRDEECPGEKPASSKECYSTTGCQWWTGQWGNCNATCGLGYETRSLVCGAESCDPGSAPVSVRPCRSTMHCEWQIGDWGPCSTACGDGVSARPVACPSGEDADCAFSPRPLDRKECRNVTGCTWSTSSWSVCSQSCGEGTQTRAVLCPSGSAADCGESSKPIALQSCEGRLGCQWQMGDWSSCSTHCGDGTRQRSVRCSGTDVEHCNASTRPLSDEPCSSSACDAWSLGDWSPCSTECGDGVQQRSVQCTEPASCGESPASQQVCFESSGCHWVVGSWSNCSEGCGLGTRSREIRCSGGAQEFCRATRPADRQSCDADSVARSMIGPSCGWTAGAWSACGANCGPQQREVTCSAACFGKAPSALRPCEDAGSACADQGNASARFEVSLLMDDLSTELLTNLVAGTRERAGDEHRLHLNDQTPALVLDAMTTTEAVSSGTYSLQRQVQVSVPPNWKRFLLVLPIFFLAEISFYGSMAVVSTYVPIYPPELIQNAVIPYAPLSWIPVMLALSAGEGVTKWDSAVYGAFMNFCIFGCFQGTSLVFFELYRQLNWWTPVVDTIWGTFAGGEKKRWIDLPFDPHPLGEVLRLEKDGDRGDAERRHGVEQETTSASTNARCRFHMD